MKTSPRDILPPKLAALVESFTVTRCRREWVISGTLIAASGERVPFCSEGCRSIGAALRALEAAVAAASAA